MSRATATCGSSSGRSGPIKFVAGQAVREAERVQEHRSEDRPARRRSGAQAGHRQARELLPVALGRQELAADRVQPEDADDLHPGQREPVRDDGRQRRSAIPQAAATSAPPARMLLAPGADHIGEVQAWNVDTGARVWTHTFPSSPTGGRCWRPAAASCSRGGTNDRKFHAFDAHDRQACCGSSRPTPASSGSRRRSASTASSTSRCSPGWGIDSRAMQGRLNRLVPGEYPEVPEGGAIWVFAIK